MTHKKIRKAILPVAGFGTRFLPVTKTQPKEMLPIIDKPVIQYLVEEAVASGIEEIILVTGRGKSAIEDYFDVSFELEYNLVEKGKHELLNQVRQIAKMARFVYVRQPIPKGDGHAILCAKELVQDEPFAVLYGDDIVDSERPALGELIKAYNETGSSIVGLTNVAKTEVSNYGIVETDTESINAKITSVKEKPSPSETTSTKAIIGKYIITPEVLNLLAKIESGQVDDGEIRLADALKEAVTKNIPLYGIQISGTRYDTGSKIGFLKATVDYALKRPELRSELLEHLRTIDLSG
ncbi:UTP--glucose-1-phosphate uridylyltransferase [Candidatus Gracilibacteria bacterium]|jgi:UTP--glucose-1-phosphate uridylyltransferase|nr:UTP--glucose-1-phosphate uridylyltransferase [Candidatus Gracilibacteria bacterium]